MHRIYGIIKNVAVIKRRVKYILNNLKFKYCTKEISKNIIKNNDINMIKSLMIIPIIIPILAIGVFVSSYTPVYRVSLNNEKIGYVKNKTDFEELIQEKILTINEKNAIAIELNEEPTYELKWERFPEINEDKILGILSQQTTTTYRLYAININNEAKTYVYTWDEAEEIVGEMEEEFQDSVEADITVTEKYTENLEEIKVEELAEAEANINSNLRTMRDEQERIAKSTFNGIYFSVKPVIGTITSRFGAVESVRDHTHMGMDIAAPNGTPIKAAAGGTVTQAGPYGGYGNLVVIDHGNDVTTYYGHCSEIYVSVGQEIEAGEIIAAVGSTGYSTGNHLHFEIRLNGSQVNPEEYVYR